MAGFIGLWQRIRVRRSSELCQGLSRGFSADYRVAVPGYEMTLETGVRTKAGLHWTV